MARSIITLVYHESDDCKSITRDSTYEAKCMTKGKSRLVKTLTEITACYVQLAQVDMENNFTERVYNRVDLMNLKRKNNLCI